VYVVKPKTFDSEQKSFLKVKLHMFVTGHGKLGKMSNLREVCENLEKSGKNFEKAYVREKIGNRF